MRRIETEAILLRAVDFSESDLIVHLLTPNEGRLAAIAKSARKSARRFPGTLDLFNHLQISATRKPRGLALLEKAVLVCAFEGLREVPARYALASYLVELLDRLAPEGGAAPELRGLFEFAREALAALERSRPDRRLRIFMELRALDAVGLRPELRHCVRCGKQVEGPAQVGFHVAEGGVVCPGCTPGVGGVLPVGVGTLRILERSLQFDLAHLDRLEPGAEALASAELLVHRFQRFHVGIELRSRRFLDAILGGTPA